VDKDVKKSDFEFFVAVHILSSDGYTQSWDRLAGQSLGSLETAPSEPIDKSNQRGSQV
jgi:hypothetical protein